MLTHWTVHNVIDDAARAQVDTDLAGLVDIYATGGQEQLVRRIEDRLAIITIEGNSPHYMLATADNDWIAGDIDRWPPLDPAVSEAGYVNIGEATDAYARATRLGPDLQLLVAREADGGGALLRTIGMVFLFGGAICVLLVALAGRLAAARLKGRIENINQAFRGHDAGQMTTIGHSSRPDEIDELAGHSAAAIARVEGLMEAYRDMSDQMAHEIRTPLMHLDRRLARALEARPAPDVAQRLVEAREQIRRLVSMLESLLDIAASKAGRLDRTRLEEVDFSALITRLCELYAGSAEESGHGFTWQIAPNITVAGEPMQLTRMVTNLLDNAFKYVPSGGQVHLSLDKGPVLIVSDNGPGVPREERGRIFDRFYRGGGGNTGDSAQGSGLGLALSLAIAERHGFTLTLDDTQEGASFRVQGGEK